LLLSAANRPFDFRNGMPAGSTYTRTGAATGLTLAGLIQSFSGARTNLLLRSQEFDNAAWSKLNQGTGALPVVTTGYAAGPPGASGLADRVQLDAGGNTSNDYSVLRQLVAAAVAPFTRSIYVKSNTGSPQTITLVAPVPSAKVTVPTTWTRIEQLQSTAGAAQFDISVGGTAATPATADILVYGAQLELGSVATAYIPTTTAAVTVQDNQPQRTDRGLALEPARTNVLLNSAFEGGGSTPTSWSWTGAGTSTPVASAYLSGGTAYQFVASANRPYFTQSIALASNTTYVLSVLIEDSVGFQVQNIFAIFGLPAGAVASYPQGATFAPVAGQRALLQVVTSGAAGTSTLRLGQGTQANATGSLTFSLPQLEEGSTSTSPILTTAASATRGLPVFTETVPAGRTSVLLTYADGSTMELPVTAGGTFDYVTPTVAAGLGRFGVSELVSREWKTSSFTSQALALFARMTTPPNATRRAVINTLIQDLITAGVWDKLDALYLLAAHDAQAARLNWKQALYDCTEVSGPTFTTDRGYAGNATTSYLNTGFNPATAGGVFVQDSGHVSVYNRTSRAAFNYCDIGNFNGSTSGTHIFPRTAIGLLDGRVNDLSVSPANALSAGHFVASRTSATARAVYRNGAEVGSIGSTASVAPISLPLFICALNQAGTPFFLSNDEIAQASVGAGLSAGEVSSMNAAVLAYLQAVGAA
jgi:hypothetical protein